MRYLVLIVAALLACHGALAQSQEPGTFITTYAKEHHFNGSILIQKRGEPIFAEENITDTIALPTDIVGDSASFMLSVRGESMIEAGINDGDYVVVKEQPVAENGDIVVAMTNSGTRPPWEERDDGNRWDTYMENATFLNHLVHIGKLRMEEREPYEFYFFPVEDADASAQDATPATAIPASDEPAR